MENGNAKNVESNKESGGALLWIMLAIAILAGIFFVVSYNDSKEEAAMSASTSSQQNEVVHHSENEVTHYSEDDSMKLFFVGPSLVDCVGASPQKCMIVNGDLFYDSIDDFKYEEGYAYVLKVEKEELTDVPADASTIQYTLVTEVNKVPSDILAHNWQWVGTEYDDDSVTPEDPSQYLLILTSLGNYAALTDCNNILGEYIIDDEELTFAPGVSTRKFCENSLETVFANDLADVEEYAIDEEGQLVLALEDGGEMIFAPLVKVNPQVTATVWEWTKTRTVYGQEILPKQNDAFRAEFGTDGSFGATTDCNNLKGSYDATIYGSMTFGSFATTRKACEAGSQEAAFSKMLSETDEYKVTSDTELLLKQKLGSVMTFIAVEETDEE